MSDVQITVDLPYPSEVVWRAMTERRLMSEWFLPTDLAPVAGGVYRVFPPPGLAGFPAPFDVDVVEVIPPERLLLRWRGEQMHTEVSWELTPTTDGCRLAVTQNGFLGLNGERRRAELLEAYEVLFSERLPALLARLALDEVLPPAPLPLPVPPVQKRRSLPSIPTNHRLRLLSVLGSIILTVLIATTLATLVLTPPKAPARVLPSERGPDRATQAAVPSSDPPTPATTSAAPKPRAGHTAAFRKSESYSGGYIGAITIRAGDQAIENWTATIELPAGAGVSSAWDRTTFRTAGDRVTFTPQPVHEKLSPGTEFTFFFQVNGSDAVPAGCAVNGAPCAGLA